MGRRRGVVGSAGSVGAAIQNVGAYGQEVAETIASVRCWDRRERTVRTIAAAECGFGYRTSRFKQDPTRHVVLTVTFQLRLGDLGAPVRYAELARHSGSNRGRVPMAAVRETVCGFGAARAWCSTPRTTTPGAPGRSSPTLS